MLNVNLSHDKPKLFCYLSYIAIILKIYPIVGGEILNICLIMMQ